MKKIKIGFALIAAFIAMSFTFVSRSGASKTLHYTPEINCYKDFTIFPTNFVPGDFAFFLGSPTSAGCGFSPCNVKQFNGSKPLFGDLLCSSSFNPVTDLGTIYAGKCDETLNAICCFHINPTTLQILDICSGRQVAN
jgi:hypothetical protein